MSKKNKTAEVPTRLSKKQIKRVNAAIDEALKVGDMELDPQQLRRDLFNRFKVSSVEEIKAEQLLPVLNWIELAWPQLEAQRRLRSIWHELQVVFPLINNSINQAETFVL